MVLPDLETLRAFVSAARRLNFRAAAAEVACSPTAFSERIARLEADLGVALFERTTRKVRLTAAGHRLLPQAERALAEARACAQVAAGEARQPFSLTIGTRFELGLSLVVPALEALEAERPERTIHLAFGTGPTLLADLQAGRLDAIITSARLTAPDLDFAALHAERYALVASPLALARHPLTGPADAAAHRLIDLRADLPLFRYFLDTRPGAEVWRFGGRQFLGTIAAVRARVLAGAGVAVLPTYFIAENLRTGALQTAGPATALTEDVFRLVWRQHHPLAEALRDLGVHLAGLPLQ